MYGPSKPLGETRGRTHSYTCKKGSQRTRDRIVLHGIPFSLTGLFVCRGASGNGAEHDKHRHKYHQNRWRALQVVREEVKLPNEKIKERLKGFIVQKMWENLRGNQRTGRFKAGALVKSVGSAPLGGLPVPIILKQAPASSFPFLCTTHTDSSSIFLSSPSPTGWLGEHGNQETQAPTIIISSSIILHDAPTCRHPHARAHVLRLWVLRRPCSS